MRLKDVDSRLSERVHDIPDAGALRFGKLWLDKEDKGRVAKRSSRHGKEWESTLHWPSALLPIKLNYKETEIMRLFMAVSAPNATQGSIVSTRQLLKFLNEGQRPDEIEINENLARQYIFRIRKYLADLTDGAITLEDESHGTGHRGYFLRINKN